MANPNLYRKKNITSVRNRTTFSLSSDESTAVRNTINKFFDLFKVKHT